MKSKKAKILLDQLETTYLGGFTAYNREDVIKIVETPEKEFTEKVYHELSNGAIPELSAAILTYLVELHETTLGNN